MLEAQPSTSQPDPDSASELPRSGEKYDRILDAAIEVIAEKGLARTRISDIASRAGVADGTIYLYFKNKNHILRSAIDSAFAQFSARVSVALSSAHSPVEQLAIIALLHLQTLSSRRSFAVILQTEVRQSARFIAEFTHDALSSYINLVRDVIRRGQADGVIRRQISDRVAALCFFGALDEIISSWLFTGKPIDPEHAAGQVLAVLLHGMSTLPRNA